MCVCVWCLLLYCAMSSHHVCSELLPGLQCCLQYNSLRLAQNLAFHLYLRPSCLGTVLLLIQFFFLLGAINASPAHPGRTSLIQIYFARSPLSQGSWFGAYTNTCSNTSWPTWRKTGHLFAMGRSDAIVTRRSKVHFPVCQALCPIFTILMGGFKTSVPTFSPKRLCSGI